MYYLCCLFVNTVMDMSRSKFFSFLSSFSILTDTLNPDIITIATKAGFTVYRTD